MANFNKAVKIADAGYSNRTPTGFKKNKELSSRVAKVYEDEETNDVYLTFRGTNPTNPADLFSDLYIARGLDKYSPRYNTAREQLTKTKQYYAESNKNIILSSHSLGANVSKHLAQNEKGIDSAYLFSEGSNPYYAARDSLYDKITFKKDNKVPIYSYSTGVDPISMGIYVPQKNVTAQIIPRKANTDPHSLQNFIV